MSYLALYRKYRPKTFDEVIDQKHITQTLINQIEADKIGHAYLFCGSRGTGKTSTAKIFARAINCEKPVNGSACGECETCKSLAMGNNLDVLEIDAASNNGVDEIRELREQVKYPPVNGRYKVYIIDEVHMLTQSAFNALLKTLEEPPKYVVFILATTESHKIPATILSRCMRFDFKLVSTEEIAKLLEKILTDSKITFEEKAVQIIARAGDGSVRDALSIADMVISYSGGNLTYDNVARVVGSIEKEKLFNIVEGVLEKDMGKVLEELDKCLAEGKPPQVLSKELISYFRDLLVISSVKEEKAREMVIVPQDIFENMKGQATSENYSTIIGAIESLSTVEQDLRYSVQPKIILESAIVKTMNYLNLEARVTNLEKKLQGESLEVKKKITEYKKVQTRELTIKERLLKKLRAEGEMIIYSAVVDAVDVKIKDKNLVIEVKLDSDKALFEEKRNYDALKKILAEYTLVIDVVGDSEAILIENIKRIVGEKLKIED